MQFSYKKSGVDTKKASEYISLFQKDITDTHKNLKTGKVTSNFGGFAGIFQVSKKWNNCAIVATTDGVGTKIHLCNQWEYIKPLGQDLVAMCVNDLYCIGATPMFFLDYIACEKLHRQWYEVVMRGIIKSCKLASIAILGGETAEHPHPHPTTLSNKHNYDLAGFCVGLVEPKKALPQIKSMKAKDCIVGIPSSGFHSNGFSLIRKILNNKKKETKLIRKIFSKDTKWQRNLLAATRIYKEIPKMLEQVPIKGICHITGGGIYENLPRIIPKNLYAYIESPWYYTSEIFQIFTPYLEAREMFSTWNMGLGMIMILEPKHYSQLQKFFPDSMIIGYLEKQKKSNENTVLLKGIDD